jgi:hypothetical protein
VLSAGAAHPIGHPGPSSRAPQTEDVGAAWLQPAATFAARANRFGSDEQLRREMYAAVKAAVARYTKQSDRDRSYSQKCAVAAVLAWMMAICTVSVPESIFGVTLFIGEELLPGLKARAAIAISCSLVAATLLFLHRREQQAARYLDDQLAELELTLTHAISMGPEATAASLSRLGAKYDRHRRWWTLLRRDHGKQMAEILASLTEIYGKLTDGKSNGEAKDKP